MKWFIMMNNLDPLKSLELWFKVWIVFHLIGTYFLRKLTATFQEIDWFFCVKWMPPSTNRPCQKKRQFGILHTSSLLNRSIHYLQRKWRSTQKHWLRMRIETVLKWWKMPFSKCLYFDQRDKYRGKLKLVDLSRVTSFQS